MRGLLAPLIKLSAFIVVTVLFTTILGISIANVNTTSTNAYKARFSDATLLLPNDDVRIAGVRVGQVKDVRIVDRRQAEVEFEVDAGRKLPAGVTAQIKFRNLVGQRYVSLGQGTDSSGKNLEPGGNIPLERTTPALDLTQLFNGFKPLFTALNPDDINKLSYEVIQVLQGEGGTVESLLKHTASLATTISDKDQVIGEVIDNLNSVLDTVNAHTPQLNDLIVRLQQLVSGLAADREPIGDAIDSLGTLAQTTSGLLGEAREPLKQDIAALGTLTKNLNDSQPIVEHFIQFLPQKVTALTRTADYGSWFNFFACELKGAVALPPLINAPIDLPLLPVNRARCTA
ncbi:MCE family protein [Amycolatopsis oliviviridis]|uniref:ABC transporter substrate-binding protein n=1 Tax=Amycolatopsis oliviviridis TaxID=1471590 RepID=A0ABQ3LWD1_9PSEU|nr:MCE family protein [Amycolatopsis oliviviridis]GHH26918.1 ABC transporter substrate-binding protein [Amycolatopsis oliviviridis]